MEINLNKHEEFLENLTLTLEEDFSKKEKLLEEIKKLYEL